MTTLIIQQKSFSLKRTAESLVEILKIYGLIKPLQIICGHRLLEEKLIKLRSLPKDTVGNDIAILLDEKGLKLIPKFESHDLKHLILEYGMTAQEELKMQAYLFGNGNRSILCILFLLSGILFPNEWKEYYREYKKGKIAPSILNLSVKNCMNQSTDKLRKKYTVSKKNK